MKTKWLGMEGRYDGTQLRSLHNYLEAGLLGDSAVAFVGPCQVPFEHMVDGEDLVDRSEIRGDQMLHFLVELFNQNLSTAVAFQRLMAALIKDVLEEREISLRRSGDDLFFQDRKLSISIATVSPVSALIHFAMNVTNQGTPVPTAALEEWGIDPRILAEEILARIHREWEGVRIATQKVKWVK